MYPHPRFVEGAAMLRHYRFFEIAVPEANCPVREDYVRQFTPSRQPLSLPLAVTEDCVNLRWGQ